MRYPLYFDTPLAFKVLDGGVPWNDLRKILHGGQRMAKVVVHSGEEILPKVSTLTNVYRQVDLR